MHLSISLATVALLALRHASAIKCRDHSPTADPLHPSADVITSIQQTLSLFPVAIDSKQYGLLDQVFTPTASVAFTPTEVPSGLSNIQAWLENVLKDLTSHHHLGGLQINQTNPCEATAINYLQGSFFGQGPAAGQIFFDFGYYEDQLVKDGGAGSNKWLVQSRVLHAVITDTRLFDLYRAITGTQVSSRYRSAQARMQKPDTTPLTEAVHAGQGY